MKNLTLLFVLLTTTVHSQSLSNQVNNYFLSIRSNKNPSPPAALINDRKNEQTILAATTPYFKDSITEIRYAAYSLTASLGRQSTVPAFRKEVVSHLIGGWRDKDSGINGQVGSSLQQFKPDDFSPAAKDTLRALVKRIPPYTDKLAKLCGYLGMNDQIGVFQSQIQAETFKSKSDKWAMYLALCRLGDPQAISYVMTRVKKLAVSDDVVYEIFPDLVYTRQREAIDYLIEAVNSDEKNCEPANPETTGDIPCAYRVMEMIAPVIKDFPLKTDASGDLVTSDYPGALQQVRKWLKEKSNYTIITSTY